jgi:hypothetical protein
VPQKKKKKKKKRIALKIFVSYQRQQNLFGTKEGRTKGNG